MGYSQILSQTLPASNAAAITPNDTTALTHTTRAIYVGGAGNLVVQMQGGGTVTFTGVTAGTVYSLRVEIVKATGTTATNLVALW